VKKSFFILAVLFSTGLTLFAQAPTERPGTIVIATWNIRDFSDKTRDDQELAKACEILKMFDLIAIQEVQDTKVLDRVVAMLKSSYNLSYTYAASPKAGASPAIAEIFAMLYRSDKISISGNAQVLSSSDGSFTRQPYFALFTCGSFTFVVMDAHFSSEPTVARQEAGEVAKAFQAVERIEGDDDVILAGDFNLKPTDRSFAALKAISSVAPVDDSIPTTNADKFDDNLWLKRAATTEYTGEWDVYKFDEIMFGNDDKAASLAVSDHRPVWARFSIVMEGASHQ
jgi:endonuclease/exonuclease/phosphatase family metal-dependent hydrolase